MLNRRHFMLSAGTAMIGSSAFIRSTSWAQPAPQASYIPNHPDYAAYADAIQQQRWTDLVSGLSRLPPQSRYTLLRDIGDSVPIREELDALAEIPGGASIAGGIFLGWAWRYRGKDVEIENEDGFAYYLFSGTDLLTQAIDDDPDDGVAAAFLFRALKATGDADSLHDLLPIYLGAKQKPVEGLTAYADAVSAKWAGSESESLQFAHDYAGSAPPASFGLIPEIHMTTAVARTMADDPDVVASAETYFDDPEISAEIIAAEEEFLAAEPDPDPFAMLLAYSQFSLAFLQLQDAVRARRNLAGQGYFAGGPWRDIDDAQAIIRQMRAALGIESI